MIQVRLQLRRWIYIRDVLRVLVARDFKLRYKRSLLGIAWSLLVPLAQLMVFYVVFKRIVPLSIPHYTTFLFTGILPWNWLQTSLLLSALAVVENRDLVKQVGFPVSLLPAVSVLSQLIHFLLSLPILAFFMISDGYTSNASLVSLVVVIMIQFLFTASLAYIIAALQVRFRDTQYLLGIGLFLFFYLTPVFWDDTSISEPFRTIMQWNPVALLLNAYRAILLHGVWPEPLSLAKVAAGSMLALALAYTTFSLSRDRFVEEL